MATKTISIDLDAYRRLKSVQQENESFSQTIKRVVPQPVSTDELVRMLREAGPKLGEGFYQGVESALAARNAPADRERFHGLLGYNGRAAPARARGKAKTTGRRVKTQAA